MSGPPSSDELLRQLEPFGMRLDLAPFRRLLAALGDPQRGLPAVLVAGTNGKGSTAALLAAMGCAAGYRTGLYTSPHLEEPRERIRIDGMALATLELDRLLAEVVAAAGGEPPTPFEALTAAAIVAFVEAAVDLVVLEVGLGGRLDATNAVEPVLSLVSEVARDHEAQLGSSLQAIATEKAGIFRPGRPALAWVTAAEAAVGLRRAAAAGGVELELLPERWRGEVRERRAEGQRVCLTSPQGRRELWLPLAGDHQLGNLVLAVAAAEQLARRRWSDLDERAIARGVAGCRWPGRLESVELADGRRVLLDGAHNPHALGALAASLATAGPYALVFGALADKDVVGMVAQIARGAEAIYLAPPATSRALPLRALAALPGLERAVASGGAAPALDAALAARPGRVVVTGSLYLVGECRRLLRERFGVPAAAAAIATWSEPA